MSTSVHPSQSAKARPARVRPDEVARRCKLPNGSERVEVYGLDGRLHRSEEPDGSSIAFRYTIDGEISSVESSSGERVGYEGLSERKTLRSKTDRCDTTVEFDERGFPSRLIQRVDGFEWRIDYQRDEMGGVVACLYPQAHDWLQSSESVEGSCASVEARAGSQSYFRVSAGPSEQRIEYGDGTRAIQSMGDGTALEKISLLDARGAERLAISFEMEHGRLSRAGAQSFEYDEEGRLARCEGPDQDLRYEYDEARRMVKIRSGRHVTELGYADHPAPVSLDGESLAYDALGRRASHGEKKYHYNSFGQLVEAALADGSRARYVYDGFGRLVARERGGERVYYVVDFEGHRICEAASDGRVLRSYLWLGMNCVAEVEGVIGQPLARSFHRGHSGRLYAIGQPGGELTAVAGLDPYGADQLRADGVPSFGSLFCDPETGLYHAGSRWFDPATAQFLTPDGWFGTDTWNHLPQPLRIAFDALPGGTSILNSPEAAYAWCRYDPINYSDPNGHSAIVTGLGLLYSIISFFLWQMQVTAIALKMAALNFLIMILPSIFDAIYSAAKGLPLWGVNVFNAILPLLGSSRLMVPWAFPLNSLYNAPGTVFTMGSVIWMRGSQHRKLDESAKRDILVCNNAADYLAANSVAADVFAVPRANIKGAGTMDAGANLITAAALDPALAPATLTDVFRDNDPIGVRLAAGGQDEFLTIAAVAGANIALRQPLPPAFRNQPVEFFRLDRTIVKMAKEGRTLARSISFIRGKSIHYNKQLPDDFPTSGLEVTEFFFKVDRKIKNFTANNEFALIEFSAADIGSYNPGAFLRILSGSKYFGRKMERKQGVKNLVLDSALAPGATPLDTKVEVVVMNATADPPVNNQSSAGDKITLGAMRNLRKRDGLTIAVGAGAVEDRRIVLEMFLRCTVDNLPASLHGKPLKLDLVMPEATRGNGNVSTVDTVTVGRDQAKQFKANQAVRITAGPGKEFSGIVKSVTPASETIKLTENLPVPDFAVPTPVTVVSLKAIKTFDGEPAAAPGGSVDVKSDDLASPRADDLLLVRPATGADEPVLRKVKGDPVVVAQLDSAPTHNANLTVQPFSSDAATIHQGVAKKVVIRLTPSGGPHAYAQNDEIYCKDNDEEYIGKNLAAPGADVLLEDPITTRDFGAGPATITLMLVERTTKGTPDGSLDESLIAIPSDPDEDPVRRGRAVELHEMRHVWQYALLGPFFFSQPLPWLINLGFTGDKSSGKWSRYFSVGGLEKLFSVVAWGISGADKSTSVGGAVANAERTRVTFDAEVSAGDVAKYSDGAPVEVTLNDKSIFTIIDKAIPNERRIDLRAPLDEGFNQGVAVRVTVSPFEKINAKMNDIFDLSALWQDHVGEDVRNVLKGFMNRENWFPLLGLYPITLLRAGFNQTRMYFEQDASFQSGDLYTPFGIAYPNEIFVGEFSKVFAFISGRGGGDLATGVSRQIDITHALTVEAPAPPAGKTATDMILGSASAGGNEVRFRKEFMIPVNEKVENVMGAMFQANTSGKYKALALGFSLDNMVAPTLLLPPFIPFFPASFNDARIINVKRLVVEKEFTNASPLFETETTTFVIKGAENVEYSIDYKPAHAGPRGVINNRTFTAPVLGGPQTTHNLVIKSTYRPNHSIFKGNGKLHGDIALPAASLTNECQNLDVVIAPITVGVAPTVKANGSTQIDASISPRLIELISAVIPEAATQASLVSEGGRPAKLKFRAPNRVNAAQDVKFRLTFGPGTLRQIEVTIRVEP